VPVVQGIRSWRLLAIAGRHQLMERQARPGNLTAVGGQDRGDREVVL